MQKEIEHMEKRKKEYDLLIDEFDNEKYERRKFERKQDEFKLSLKRTKVWISVVAHISS